MISMALARAVSENIRAGRQSILLLNRRGYHTYAVCKDCKTVAACPNCSISMTYHAANNRLMCHYCGFSQPVPERCPACGGPLKPSAPVPRGCRRSWSSSSPTWRPTGWTLTR